MTSYDCVYCLGDPNKCDGESCPKPEADHKELADRIVELLDWSPEIRNQPGYVGDEQFVNDWRVAGAMMQLIQNRRTFEAMLRPVMENWWKSKTESLPLAINMATVEALDG